MSTVEREPQARLFVLYRSADATGVSGTGIVADGVQWPGGQVTIRWRGKHRSTVHWDELADVLAIHGHDGATRPVWLSTPNDGEADIVFRDGLHLYWSTHCRHGKHDACAARELAPGLLRRPAECKTCAAPCQCECHAA